MRALRPSALARRQIAVLIVAALALAAVMVARNRPASAHEVTTAYPLTCSMLGLNGSFTTSHGPNESGVLAGQVNTIPIALTLTAGSGAMTMNVSKVSYKLVKPSTVSSFGAVSFAGTGMAGSAAVDPMGDLTLTYTGSQASNALALQAATVTMTVAAGTPVGTRVILNGPASISFDNGSTDTCNAAAGPIAILNAGVVDPGGPTTTHGDHEHDEPTTTTTMPTTTTSAVTTTTKGTTTTTTASTTTTKATTTTRPTTTTTMHGGIDLWAIIKFLLFLLFGIVVP